MPLQPKEKQKRQRARDAIRKETLSNLDKALAGLWRAKKYQKSTQAQIDEEIENVLQTWNNGYKALYALDENDGKALPL